MYPNSRKPATARHLTALLLSFSLLSLSQPASAAQVLEGKADDTLSATVSRTEPTLIRVEGHRVRRVFGAEGEFALSPDKDAGTAYLKPLTDKKGLSTFVSDETGRTWKLLLSVVEGPADTIVIKGGAAPGARTAGRDLPRTQAIKRVLLALDSGDESDMASKSVKEVVPLWNEVLFVLVRTVNGPLRGEKYRLTNASAQSMVVDERELYRRRVVAISVANPHLSPGETTDVFVISESSDE